MFYSQLLLSKTGALGIVWMAAHCHKRLKKHQIQQTDISSSVDKILDDEVRAVTHRILAFLLLGVVRIYSKKVEYLFNDCHEILNRLCNFKTGKSKQAGTRVSLTTHYHSISLPKRFELDTFDLDFLEDQDVAGGNVRSHLQDKLADGRREDGSTSGLLYKENTPISEAQSKACTPPRDVFGPHQMDQNLFVGPSSNLKISLTGVDVLRGTRFSLDSILLDEAEEQQTHRRLFDEDLRTNFQGPACDMDSDFDAGPPNKKSHLSPSLERFHGTIFALEDRLEPMVLDEAEQEQLNGRPNDQNVSSNLWVPIQDVGFDFVSNQGSDCAASFEVVNESGISLVQLPNFKMSNEVEKGQGHGKPPDKEDRIEEEHVGPPSTQLAFQEGNFTEPVDETKPVEKGQDHGKPPDKDRIEEEHVGPPSTQLDFQEGDFTEPVDETKPVDARVKVVGVITPECVKCQRQEEFRVSIVNSGSKIPAPEVATVQTPGRKERAKILKKRKTLLDFITVVPNKVFKNWIDDPTDIKRKKREVPHTLLNAWRACKHAHIPQSFFEPSISSISEDLGYLESKRSCAQAIKAVESSSEQDGAKSPITYGTGQQIPAVRSPVREESPGQTLDIRSPVRERSPDRTPIAPGTPAAHPHGAVAIAYSDIIEPATSYESVDKGPFSSDPLELDVLFQEETSSFERETLEKDIHSARTRLAGNYLGRKFLDKKRRKKEEVLNLSRLLAGKTKKESARLFYETLVLKTRDCIDVQQETAYCDILLRETPKLRQAF